MRWLLALISDTGMRLAEAAGIHNDDILLDVPVPYIDPKAHSRRRLKTKSSERHISLVDASLSLWAAQRIKQIASSYFAFDRYTDNQQFRANSVSNALNKWIQTYFRDCYTWLQICPQRPFKSRTLPF